MGRKYMSDEDDKSGDRGDQRQWGENTGVMKVIKMVTEETGVNGAKIHE